jgi:hypothetical protein
MENCRGRFAVEMVLVCQGDISELVMVVKTGPMRGREFVVETFQTESNQQLTAALEQCRYILSVKYSMPDAITTFMEQLGLGGIKQVLDQDGVTILRERLLDEFVQWCSKSDIQL